MAASVGLTLAICTGGAPAWAAPAAALSLRETPLHHEGIAVSVGGGVTAYTTERTREVLGTGGYWEVRGLLGARSFIGNELAYVGSSRAIGAAGAAGDSAPGGRGYLLGNGVEMAARLNLPLQFQAGRVTPFVFVGPGVSRLSIVGSDARPPGNRTADTIFVLTSGTGVALTYGKVVLGARLTYRQSFGADLIRIADESARLQSWSLALTVGREL